MPIKGSTPKAARIGESSLKWSGAEDPHFAFSRVQLPYGRPARSWKFHLEDRRRDNEHLSLHHDEAVHDSFAAEPCRPRQRREQKRYCGNGGESRGNNGTG
jgi:hypothetical protein